VCTRILILQGLQQGRLVWRRQVRATWRQPLELRATLADISGTVVDLHESGVLVALPGYKPSALPTDVHLLLTVWPDEDKVGAIEDVELQPFHGLGTLTRPPTSDGSITFAGGRVQRLSTMDRLAARKEVYVPAG